MASYLHSPLLALLANRSQLEVLRFLAIEYPLSKTAGEILQAVTLSKQGLFNAMDSLENLGILMKSGKKGNTHYTLREAHPFFRDLKELFQKDTEFLKQLFQNLTSIFDNEPIHAVYVSGSLAVKQDHYADLIELDLISEESFQQQLKQKIIHKIKDSTIETRFDVSFYIRMFSIEDYKLANRPHQLIWGFDVLSKPQNSKAKLHSDLDLVSLENMNRFLKELSDKPDLRVQVISDLEKNWDSFSKPVQKTYAIWLDMLKNWPIARIRLFFKQETELRTQLLQSNPFWLIKDLNGMI